MNVYDTCICSSFLFQIGQGGDVPKSYYKQQMFSTEIENAVTASVGRGSSLQVECDVPVQNSAIRYMNRNSF